MNENHISTGKVVTTGLWCLVGTLLLAAWVSWLVGSHDSLAHLLGLTACTSSAAAATAHVRVYAVRICALIRLVNGLDGRESSVRALRD